MEDVWEGQLLLEIIPNDGFIILIGIADLYFLNLQENSEEKI